MVVPSVARLAARWCDMRKYRKFNEGGSSDLEDFEDKAMPKRVSALDDLASGADKGSFDEDVYARAKRFRESGGQEAAPKPKPKTVPPAGTSGGAYRGQRTEMPARAASAEIPKGSASAPASTGEDTSGPSNLDRILMGVGAGAGVAGAAKLAQMSRAKRAAETSKAAASKFASPQTAKQVTTDTGRRFTPKAEMEAAESTMRGAVGRKDIQAKRAATAKGRAETMEANKPVLQATPKKASPRSRTEDRDVDYELRAKGGRVGYAKGGAVRGGGCETRGKTRGVMR